MSRRSPLALVLAAAVVLAGCSDDPDDPGAGDAESTTPPAQSAAAALAPELLAPTGPTTVVAGSAAGELAVGTSQSVYATAPVVVLAPLDDVAAQARAASLAVQLGVPMLLGERSGTPGAPAESPPADTAPAPGESGGADAPTASGDAPAFGGTSSADETVPLPTASGDATTTEPTPPAPPAADGALGAAVTAELQRLGATTVLDVGGAAAALELPAEITVVPAPADDADLEAVLGVAPGAPVTATTADVVATVAALDPASPALVEVSDAPTGGGGDSPAATATGSGAESDGAQLPAVAAAASPASDLLVLATADPIWLAATATARAAGARVQVLSSPDPRSDTTAVAALADQPPTTVLALGDAFGTPETLRYRLDVAATGVELPGGGQVLFPGRRMVALYGNPTSGALGVLGEQPLEEAIARAERVAAEYDGLWGDDPVVPAFEVIATVASEFAGPDGNYSTEMAIEDLRPYVDAAGEAGVYVVLDLQPGRTDFLTQAKIYEELLREPHVGLALDPEWRLEPGQVHLRQIGSVGVDEVNAVGTWLADLTRANNLPQKLLLLHQFRLDMIEGRERLDTSRDELGYLIHADGNGPPGSKYATYGVLTASPPPNVWWGWKNFYDEDSPTFTPAQTAAVEPSPVFVSYQ